MTDDVSLFMKMRAEIEELNIYITVLVLKEPREKFSVLVGTEMKDGGNNRHVVVDYIVVDVYT